MNELIEYNMSDNLQKDLNGIIENAQQTAIVSVNSVLVIRNWLIGMRISREKMSGTRSERYGEGIISELADELTQKYGKGFDKRSLYRYVQFYQSYPEIVGIMTPQSQDIENTGIVGITPPQSGEHAMIVKGRRTLTWSHYERLSLCRRDIRKDGADRGYTEEPVSQHGPGGRNDLPDYPGNTV